MKRLCWLLVLLISNLLVHGQESFYRVYQFETPYKGHLELTEWTTFIPKSDLSMKYDGRNLTRDNLFAHSIEAEYGVGDHFVLAAYADFEDAKYDRLNYTRSRIEARYRFGERFDHFINTAAYLEYYIPEHSYSTSQEIEARLIMDKDIGDYRLALNPTLSKYVNGDEDRSWQPALNAGVYYRRGGTVQPGLEYYENFEEHTVEVFPTIDVNINGNITWNLGLGFGLNNTSDNVTIKSILQVDLQAIRPSKLMRHNRRVY